MIFEKPYKQYEGSLLESPDHEEYYFIVKYLPTLPSWDTRKNVVAFDMFCVGPKRGAFLSGLQLSKNTPDSLKRWMIKEIWSSKL